MIITGEQIQQWRRWSSAARFWVAWLDLPLLFSYAHGGWLAGRGRADGDSTLRKHPKDVLQSGVSCQPRHPRGRYYKQAGPGRTTLYFE